jgi:hypothetical protein
MTFRGGITERLRPNCLNEPQFFSRNFLFRPQKRWTFRSTQRPNRLASREGRM